MLQRLGKPIVDFWSVLAFGLTAALIMQPAHAAMIGTETAHAQCERAASRPWSSAPSFRRVLKQWACPPAEALACADAMSDAEVL